MRTPNRPLWATLRPIAAAFAAAFGEAFSSCVSSRKA